MLKCRDERQPPDAGVSVGVPWREGYTRRMPVFRTTFAPDASRRSLAMPVPPGDAVVV
jgi:hypothetical protein